jgi:single-stranded DNA-binding protein
VSLAGNLTDDPELRHTEGGIARAMFLVAVSGKRVSVAIAREALPVDLRHLPKWQAWRS